jgi:hypothetical protein
MQYLLLIYEDETAYGPYKQGGEALNKVVASHMAFGQSLGARRLAGAGLKNTDSATTVRTGPGGAKTVHDGPFAETKEQLGGFYMIEAADLDEAISMARQVPLIKEGSVEIRPLLGHGEAKVAAE